MRQIGSILFVLLMMVSSTVLTRAAFQEGRRSGGFDRTNDRARAMERENQKKMVDKKGELRDWERMQPMTQPNHKDLEIAYQLKIEQNIKQLDAASDALLSTAERTDEKSLKEVAKLADRIAKLSKRLRQDLNPGEYISKVEPALPDADDRASRLRQIAESIDNLVEKLRKAQEDSLRTVDVNRHKESSRHLELIESQALRLRAIAKGKA
jgi:hypothetical protein